MSVHHRILARIVVAALLLRLAMLVVRGDYIVYDEGYYLLLARSLGDGHGLALNGLPQVALSPLQPLVVALLSLTGIPELWASRLLAAVAGALLAVPVAAIARRLGGARAGLVAALLVAAAPALMTFVPFFPGEGWNLYFGSEPLFLLLAAGTIAAAMRALDGDRAAWWAASGALAAASFLTRGEGLVLGPVLLLLLAARALVARRRAAWRGLATAAGVGLVCAAPYLLYLRAELGRWALSGRVQAAASLQAAATAPGTARPDTATGRPRPVAEGMVWEGNQEAFWRAAYRLDGSGTRMASQYWGVPSATAPAAKPVTLLAAGATTAPPERASSDPTRPRERASAAPTMAAATAARPAAAAPREPDSRLTHLARGFGIVAPVWLLLLAGVGLAVHRRRHEALFWLTPLLVAAVLPALLVYVEPRGLLPVVPIAAIGAALVGATLYESTRGERRRRARRLLPATAALVALVLAVPALRELARAAPGTRPLQRVSAARHAVGTYLRATLPDDAIVASWHPAVAYFAEREWRVLPYEPVDRVLGYARAQGASAVVLSRFEPSPLPLGDHAFHVLLLDPRAPAGDSAARVRLERVAEMPLLVVSRVVPVAP